jgi:hypothetical protein
MLSRQQAHLFADYDFYKSVTGLWVSTCVYCGATKFMLEMEHAPAAWREHMGEFHRRWI